MIVRRDGSDWLLITQPDHSALAGRIMAAWHADNFPDRPTRARVLRATGEHDIGWTPEDAAPRITVDGNPADFMTVPTSVKQDVWPVALDQLAPEDPYVAALVAQHAVTVYRRYASDPAWTGFFPPLERRRDDLFAGGDFASFLQDYVIVGLGDLFSLIFCNGWQEPYLMESYQAILRDDRLTISPDPFAGATVPLDVAARRIPARPYASNQDLRDTLARAPTVRVSGLAIGAALPPIT
jgi:hypothetical protein